jgi:hypothetical protein
MVRHQIPDGQQIWVLAVTASQLALEDGFSDVNGYLEQIHATPEERSACVAKVVESKIERLSSDRKITREDVDALREWAGSQSPDSADRVTGEALVHATEVNHKLSYAEAAGLALQYAETGNRDDVLCGFLDSSSTRSNPELARSLAAKISDVKRREEILKNIR